MTKDVRLKRAIRARMLADGVPYMEARRRLINEAEAAARAEDAKRKGADE